MLTIMNEIDPCLLLPLCVLYEIQNQIYQQEANANFNIFEIQCPKIRILSKPLKAKLSKCPEWSRQFVNTS